ncbi:aldehyde dehydrogenase family protein [Falsiruegeria mediterranea]|uniref:Betaine aldehyde dehydrogenase n=1 Tax=Falsiruegeria mediterranea M17 TaxID=1200281 RepID=A0A2R8CFI7_9RHOB|nr:aldehyde dehydrogenase family protein [Falsiruegeria mediterranea]SPJ31166.1 Betaine aldehyde dehydrogenase [Falsiruegeria mediterranea M17]
MMAGLQYPFDLDPLPDAVIGGVGHAGGGLSRQLVDPAARISFAEVRDASLAQIDQSVLTAQTARRPWADTPPAQRAQVLMALADLIAAHVDELAAVECVNVGKPLSQARRDVLRAAGYYRFYAGACDKLNGDTIPLGPDQTAVTLLEPVGVTAHILPWNYPISTLARGVAPALAAGATVVAKPAELTPLSTLMVAKLALEVGVPDGAFNVICGAGEVGEALAAHPNVAHVTFTGSTETGRRVMQAASGPVAGVTLELGGKSPVVVWPDADLDAAAKGIARGIFFNAGQVCAAGSRLLCHADIHDAVVERVVQQAREMTMGHGLTDPDLGPLISEAQFARVEGFVSRALADGLTCVTGGQRAHVPDCPLGLFYEPTVFTRVPETSDIAQIEVFGPVLITQTFETEEDALRLANGTPFGLVAGIYTADTGRAMRFARRVEAGQVFVNGFLQGGDTVPFGGVKHSGIGREKGVSGLRAYLAEKSIVLSHGETS